ncbi:MAG: transglutaminase family protein [Spirosomataceae bacterium]
MNYKLTHLTRYSYVEPVNNYHGLVCLKPRNTDHQQCTQFELVVEPTPTEYFQRTDYFGNTLHYFYIHTTHQELTVIAQSEVHNQAIALELPPVLMSYQEAKQLITQDSSLQIELLEYLLPSPFITWDAEVQTFARKCFSAERPLYECVKALCHKIFKEFKFVSNFTSINTPIKTVLKERKGVCQDFSHLAIACLRSMGIPARYVSGYIETLPPPGKTKLQGSDASHAWISAYVPEIGWCEFDPTNDLVPQERHIVTAYGRDYSDVAPLKGIIFSSGQHTLKVEVDVIRI